MGCQQKVLDTSLGLCYSNTCVNLSLERTMDVILWRSYLYDFYGELLTDHQKEIYDGYVNQDLSMTEIAEEYSISKQAVSSIVKRCDEALQEYEDKLHLVRKFLDAKEGVQNMVKLAEQGKHLSGEDAGAQFDRLEQEAHHLLSLF